MVNLTVKEIQVLKAINMVAQCGEEEGGFELQLVEAKCTTISKASIAGILSSLQEKKLVNMYNDVECYFDGQITEAGIKAVKEIEDAEFDTPVVNEDVVRLNEIKDTKSSQVSKGKRDDLKAAKVLAKFALENWDSYEQLQNAACDEELAERSLTWVMVAEVLSVISRRMNALALSLPNPEKEASTTDQGKRMEYKDINGKTIKEGLWVRDITSYDEFHRNESVVSADEEGKLYVMSDGTSIYLDEIETAVILMVIDAPKTDTKPEAKQGGKLPRVKGPHKVGDRHPYHPDWVWTDRGNGKFDWRSDHGKFYKNNK